MIEADIQNLEQQVSEIRANTVSLSSIRVYSASFNRFIVWILKHKTALVPQQFKDSLQSSYEDDAALRKGLKERLNCDAENPPLYFDQLEARDFMAWLLSSKKTDGSKPGFSTYNSHRAGLFNLYRQHGKSMTKTLETELTIHLKGLKRKLATDTTAGIQRIKTDKDPLPFGLYQFICMELLRVKNKEAIFTRTF